MSAPTTAETPTMRERLARALWEHDMRVLRDHGFPAHHTWDSVERRESYVAQVDAILREMLEPSSEAVIAGMHSDETISHMKVRACWQAMIRQILNEPPC